MPEVSTITSLLGGGGLALLGTIIATYFSGRTSAKELDIAIAKVIQDRDLAMAKLKLESEAQSAKHDAELREEEREFRREQGDALKQSLLDARNKIKELEVELASARRILEEAEGRNDGHGFVDTRSGY